MASESPERLLVTSDHRRRQEVNGMSHLFRVVSSRKSPVQWRFVAANIFELKPSKPCLVGGWATPLKNISQSGWLFPIYIYISIYGKIKNVPNHQPDVWIPKAGLQTCQTIGMSMDQTMSKMLLDQHSTYQGKMDGKHQVTLQNRFWSWTKWTNHPQPVTEAVGALHTCFQCSSSISCAASTAPQRLHVPWGWRSIFSLLDLLAIQCRCNFQPNGCKPLVRRHMGYHARETKPQLSQPQVFTININQQALPQCVSYVLVCQRPRLWSRLRVRSN